MKKSLVYMVLVVAVTLLVLWALSTCGEDPGPGTSRETQRLEDSLLATLPGFVDSTRVIAQRETVYVERASSAATAATIAAARASVLRQVADSIARVAQTADEWKQAHDVRKQEADSLRFANDSLETAFSLERSARMEADRRVDMEVTRREATERVNLSLHDDLERANRRRWYDRFNITGGYGATAGPEGNVYHGASVVAGICIWPCK